MAHFENELELNESIGFADGIVHAKINICIAKSKYEVGGDQESLKASQELYNCVLLNWGKRTNSQLMRVKLCTETSKSQPWGGCKRTFEKICLSRVNKYLVLITISPRRLKQRSKRSWKLPMKIDPLSWYSSKCY